MADARTGMSADGVVVAGGRKTAGVDKAPVDLWGRQVKGEPSAVGRNFVVVVVRDTGDVCFLPRIPDGLQRLVSEQRIEVGTQPSKVGVEDR